jgi:hypothetical protein
MIPPPLQIMQPSRPPHEEQGQWRRDDCSSMLRAEKQWNKASRDARPKTLARKIEFTLATTLTQATQKSAAARPNRAPRDQAERRKPQDHYGARAMLNTTARDQ